LGSGGEERHHPDYEEVVGNHGVHFGEADGLDSNPVEDLLVGEGLQEFARDFCWVGCASVFPDDDDTAKDDGDAGGDDEGEESLNIWVLAR
jgi:hypothetical protein